MRFGAHEYISIRSDLWLTNAKEDINEKFWEKTLNYGWGFSFVEAENLIETMLKLMHRRHDFRLFLLLSQKNHQFKFSFV